MQRRAEPTARDPSGWLGGFVDYSQCHPSPADQSHPFREALQQRDDLLRELSSIQRKVHFPNNSPPLRWHTVNVSLTPPNRPTNPISYHFQQSTLTHTKSSFFHWAFLYGEKKKNIFDSDSSELQKCAFNVWSNSNMVFQAKLCNFSALPPHNINYIYYFQGITQ